MFITSCIVELSIFYHACSLEKCGHSRRRVCWSNNALEQSRDEVLWVVVPLLLSLFLNFGDQLPALCIVDTGAADMCELTLAHTSVKVDVASADEKRSMGWDLEPRPDFPDKVEEDDQRNGEAVFKERFGVRATIDGLLQTGQLRAGNVHVERQRMYLVRLSTKNRISTYIKSNINLCHQADEVQEDAQPTAPDTEGGAVWQFID